MIPYVFLLMVLLWQLVVGAYALITAQSAANEMAKVFSVTEDEAEAKRAAREIINATGNSIKYNSRHSTISSPHSSTGSFTANVRVDLELVFLPDRFFPNPLRIPIDQKSVSRVIR